MPITLEGAERSHLVGNPPVDTVTTEGWGVATPGEGTLEELPVDVHPSCTTATASVADSDNISGRMPLSRLPGHVPVEGGREAAQRHTAVVSRLTVGTSARHSGDE